MIKVLSEQWRFKYCNLIFSCVNHWTMIQCPCAKNTQFSFTNANYRCGLFMIFSKFEYFGKSDITIGKLRKFPIESIPSFIFWAELQSYTSEFWLLCSPFSVFRAVLRFLALHGSLQSKFARNSAQKINEDMLSMGNFLSFLMMQSDFPKYSIFIRKNHK